MSIKDKSIQALLEELASSTPTPGGGSAAALAGAMGAALISMVCSLTVGRKRFAEVEDELRGVLEEAQTLQRQLAGLADADSQAFDQVMAAYRLPKATDEEQAARQVAIQAAFRQATQVPLETVTACAAVIGLAGQVVSKINPNALSDAGVATLVAEAGLRGAQLNVAINLVNIHDNDFVQGAQKELDRALSSISQEKERVFSYVLEHT